MLTAGDCTGGYRLEEALGRTLLVELWDAVDIKRGTPRSLRILSQEAMSHREAFVAAGQLQRDVIHPNRILVVDVIEVDGRPAIVTEQISGPTLATWRRIRTRSPEEILEVFREIVRGVGAGHQAGLLHLGLTTSQIWMSNRRGVFVPKVELAFGPIELAGLHLGNGRAPEHAQGRPVDARADLFLLGTVLYELLTGQPLFDYSPGKRAAAAVAGGHRPVQELRPDVPSVLVDLVEALLVADPLKRVASTNDLLTAIMEIPVEEPSVEMEDPLARISAPKLTPQQVEAFLKGSKSDVPKLPDKLAPVAPPSAAPPGRAWTGPVAVASLVAVALSAGMLLWASG